MIEKITALKGELVEKSNVDMQSLALELSSIARMSSPKFNYLLRERMPILMGSVDKATMQDLVVVLSAVCVRKSR